LAAAFCGGSPVNLGLSETFVALYHRKLLNCRKWQRCVNPLIPADKKKVRERSSSGRQVATCTTFSLITLLVVAA